MSHFLPAVSVDEFKNIVKRHLENDLQRPIFGLGKGGIGKTESIANLAIKELGIGFVDIRLLLYSESDLKGIPYVNEAHSHTIWLQNDILPREDRDGAKGILLLDEVTSCSKSVRTAAYQLLNERSLGEYHLPEGWQVVCLGNAEEDGGQYFAPLSPRGHRPSHHSANFWQHWHKRGAKFSRFLQDERAISLGGGNITRKSADQSYFPRKFASLASRSDLFFERRVGRKTKANARGDRKSVV